MMTDDYTRLDQFLFEGKWNEADQETLKVMLKVAQREEQGWLSSEDLDKFPAQDLQELDQLWTKHSQGQFGFSVQREIYHSLGGTKEFDADMWVAFSEQVGWRSENRWLWPEDLTLERSAPAGHLPASGIGFVRGIGAICLLSRCDW